MVEAFLTSAVPLAFLVEGEVVLANEAFSRVLGLPAAGALGRRIEALLPPDDGVVPVPKLGASRSYRAHLDGVPARVDLAAASRARKDGRLLVSAMVTPRQDAPDTAASRALLALSRDLAEARSEEQLAAALSRALEVLFPGRPFCVRLVDPKTLALTTLYARGRLRPRARGRLAIRRSAVRKTGLSAEALEQAGIVVTEHDEPLFEDCEAALAVPLVMGGALYGIVNLEYEHGAPGDPEADGSLLVQVANQAALGVRNLRSVEDLTYLKNYLEDLIEHANALITVVNRCREVIVWNAALVALTGFGRDEVLGDDFLEVLPADERSRVEAALLRSFEGEPVSGFEVRISRKDGGEARLSVNTAPIRGASGEVEGVIAIGQDLTRIRSLEQAAEHAERLAGIGRLAAGVVHELNNPLTAVTMFSDVLIEKWQAGGDAADLEKMRAIREAGQRIQRLARDLIAYARPSGMRIEPCDLAAALEEAARMAKPALKEAGATLVRRFEPAPPVDANRPSLVQVFVNLVTNAAQALKPGGGTVTLALANEGERVRVQVGDDGTGMTAEVRAHAFEPFFTTRPGLGIGLGLPIVQEIVGRHRGRVEVETALGMGTTVSVALPVRHA
ncbi:MAG TPA: PAS domain S-box protein [Anaeromyxobacteraceae bacterium]|nr:PAS domain S-box protein [Anaeromyxobacteraceae bacterium]